MALEDLKKKLSVKGGRNDKIITRLGELLIRRCHGPDDGLDRDSSKSLSLRQYSRYRDLMFVFSKRPGTLEGSEFMPFDPATDEGRQFSKHVTI